MRRKGFYIKQGKDGSIYLNIYSIDFQQYMNELIDQDGWVTFRIYERKQTDDKGHTHNMEAIKLNKEKEKHVND